MRLRERTTGEAAGGDAAGKRTAFRSRLVHFYPTMPSNRIACNLLKTKARVPGYPTIFPGVSDLDFPISVFKFRLVPLRKERQALPDVFDRNLLKTNDRVRKQVTIFRNRFFGLSGLGEREVGLGVQSVIGAVAGKKTGMAGGGDHRRVVRRERAAREKDVDTAAGGLGFECSAQFAVRSDAAGDEDRARSVLLGRGKGLRDEIRYDRAGSWRPD